MHLRVLRARDDAGTPRGIDAKVQTWRWASSASTRMTLLDVRVRLGRLPPDVRWRSSIISVIGITLSRRSLSTPASGWQKLGRPRQDMQGRRRFDRPVDRINLASVLRAFRPNNVLRTGYNLTQRRPDAAAPSWRTPRSSSADNGIKLTFSDLKFMKFIGTRGSSGGQLPAVEDIEKLAADSGFHLERVHLLQAHYARTLDMWSANPKPKRRGDRLMDEATHDKYQKYLTGCADFFRRGITNIGQFTLVKGTGWDV